MMNSSAVTTTFETLHLVDFIAVLQALVKLGFYLNVKGKIKYKIYRDVMCIKLSEVSIIKIYNK